MSQHPCQAPLTVCNTSLVDLHLFGLHRHLHMYGIYFYRLMLWDNGIVLFKGLSVVLV